MRSNPGTRLSDETKIINDDGQIATVSGYFDLQSENSFTLFTMFFLRTGVGGWTAPVAAQFERLLLSC